MRRAIALARGALGTTGSNPAVGCILVSRGEVVGEAATAPGGRPHAEQAALVLAGAAASGATALVTLEPCGARSSGEPSCAERLAEAGVSRVVYAVSNPDARSAGRGPRRLEDRGVAVRAGFLADEAAPLYADYLAGLPQP